MFCGPGRAHIIIATCCLFHNFLMSENNIEYCPPNYGDELDEEDNVIEGEWKKKDFERHEVLASFDRQLDDLFSSPSRDSNQTIVKDSLKSSRVWVKCKDGITTHTILFNVKVEEKCDVITHVPRYYGDRFIPRRYPLNNLSKMYNSHMAMQRKTNFDFLDMREMHGYWRSKAYIQVMQSVLSIREDRIHKLADPIIVSLSNVTPKLELIERAYPNNQAYDWPCKPRSKPLACTDSTHDLPGFCENTSYNILSWSALGHIAASFKNDLVIWTPFTLNTLVYTFNNSKTIAYNPAGNILAISCRKSNSIALQLWDVRQENIIHYMMEYTSRNFSEEIQCLDWDPTGKYIACGTIGGIVQIFEACKLRKIRTLEPHSKKIFSVKFSPKMNYLAANDIGGNTCIWCWDSCRLHTKLTAFRDFKTFMDWHPWNGVDLVITEDCPAAIVVFNVPSKTIVAFYKRKDFKVTIDAISFNKRSAELLVSCTIKNSDDTVSHDILVLSSLDHIVDVLKNHDESVRYMTWSPDGMQLATAGDDDALTVWNFFALRTIGTKQNKLERSPADKESQFKLYKHIR